MRKHRWSAAKALSHLLTLRSSVSPNEGFWRQLCAFEATLAIPSAQRSDVRNAPAVTETFGELGNIKVGSDAAGERARVDIRQAEASSSPTRGVKPLLVFLGALESRVLVAAKAFTFRAMHVGRDEYRFAVQGREVMMRMRRMQKMQTCVMLKGRVQAVETEMGEVGGYEYHCNWM
jgi:hypothetical protein